jgi:hypothetical protein
VEAITQRATDSQRALADAQELYALAEARANAVIKQEEDLTVRAHQVNQWAWEVEELLQEREDEGPEKATRGVGEWEPIQIPYQNLAYISKLTRRPSLLTRPRPH